MGPVALMALRGHGSFMSSLNLLAKSRSLPCQLAMMRFNAPSTWTKANFVPRRTSSNRFERELWKAFDVQSFRCARAFDPCGCGILHVQAGGEYFNAHMADKLLRHLFEAQAEYFKLGTDFAWGEHRELGEE